MESFCNDDVSSLNARMESLGNEDVLSLNARMELLGNDDVSSLTPAWNRWVMVTFHYRTPASI